MAVLDVAVRVEDDEEPNEGASARARLESIRARGAGRRIAQFHHIDLERSV